MVKITKENLQKIQSELETADDSWQSEFNLQQTVQQLFYFIEEARKKNASWEKIAEVIREKSGITDAISPTSISKYYLDFAKHPEKLPKKKRKTNVSKDQKNDSNKDSSLKIDVSLPENSGPTQLIETEDEKSRNASDAPSKPEARRKVVRNEVEAGSEVKKFGSFYNSSDKKASDEFNL